VKLEDEGCITMHSPRSDIVPAADGDFFPYPWLENHERRVPMLTGGMCGVGVGVGF
jgi:hypothetical protein